jgi:hypothetical protein
MSFIKSRTSTEIVDPQVDLRNLSPKDFPNIEEVYDSIQRKVNLAHAISIIRAKENKATWSNFDSWVELSKNNSALALARQVMFVVE